MTRAELLSTIDEDKLKALVKNSMMPTKVFFYREAYLMVDAKIRTSVPKMVAYSEVAELLNVDESTVRLAFGFMTQRIA